MHTEDVNYAEYCQARTTSVSLMTSGRQVKVSQHAAGCRVNR